MVALEGVTCDQKDISRVGLWCIGSILFPNPGVDGGRWVHRCLLYDNSLSYTLRIYTLLRVTDTFHSYRNSLKRNDENPALWLHCPSQPLILFMSAPHILLHLLVSSGSLVAPLCTLCSYHIILFGDFVLSPLPCLNTHPPSPSPISTHLNSYRAFKGMVKPSF